MTILGMWSVAELRDLTRAKDKEMAAITQAVASMSISWPKRDAASWADFSHDWEAQLARYIAARIVAEGAFSRAAIQMVDERIIPANSEFNGLIASLQKRPGHYDKGEFQDIYNRLAIERKTEGLPELVILVPQPGNKDIDLDVYKEADKLAKDYEKIRDAATPWIIGGGIVLGLVAVAVITKKL